MLLYQHQLSFYVRVMNLPAGRWVRRVLLAHLDDSWDSPYMAYIAKIRQRLNLPVAPPTVHSLKIHLNSWFLAHTNLVLSSLSLSCVPPLSSFSRARYVVENDGCTTIALFKFNNAGLGNRAPRNGRVRTGVCSLCGDFLSEVHVAFACPGMDAFRYEHTDIMGFQSMCAARGILQALSYKMYVLGRGWDGKPVSTSVYLRRSGQLQGVLSEWLRRS